MLLKQNENLGVGCVLVPDFLVDFIADRPAGIDWIEASPSLFAFTNAKRPDMSIQALMEVRQHTEMGLHFINLNLGSTDPISKNVIESVKKYHRWLNPAHLSDHMGWRGVRGSRLIEILPLPFNKRAAIHAANRIKQYQDALGQKFLIENVACFGHMLSSDMPEWEFLSMICRDAECGLILDFSNVIISAHNNRYDARDFVDGINPEYVEQFHIAGYKKRNNVLIDTHTGSPSKESMELLEHFVSKNGARSAIFEWDQKLPEIARIQEEVMKIKSVIAKAVNKKENGRMTLEEELHRLNQSVLFPQLGRTDLQAGLTDSGQVDAHLKLYQELFFFKLCELVRSDFPQLRIYMSDEEIDKQVVRFLQKNYKLDTLIVKSLEGIPAFVKNHPLIKDHPWVIDQMKFNFQWGLCRNRGLELSIPSSEILESFWKKGSKFRLRRMDQSFLFSSNWNIAKVDQKNFRSTHKKLPQNFFIRNQRGVRKIEILSDKKKVALLKMLEYEKTWFVLKKHLARYKISQRYFFKFMSEGLNEGWLVFDDNNY